MATVKSTGEADGLDQDDVLSQAQRTAGSEASLVDTVVALRDELQGLRSASQLRAIIEQAKGVLVERHHISLDEAFDKLRAMSQEHNVRLVEVAATVVGVSVPHGAASVPEPSEQVLRGRMPTSTVCFADLEGPGAAARRPRRRGHGT